MAYSDEARTSFEIGRVIHRMTTSIGRRWRLLGVAMLLFTVLPGALFMGGLAFGGEIDTQNPFGMFTSARLASIWGLAMLIGIFAQTVVVSLILADQLGDTPVLQGSIIVALAALLPAIALKILVWLALGVASLFFIVPALLLAVRWFVALPALVAEQAGVLGSLARSRDLTRGARWSIFALIALIGALYLVLAGALAPLGLIVGTGNVPMTIVAAIAQQCFAGLASIVWTAALVSTFLELREIREGKPAGRLAEVFA